MLLLHGARTCPPESCMAVNSHPPLLQGKRHHLYHVKDSRERCHAIILPSKIIKINASLHKGFRTVGEATLLLQGVPTARVLPRTLKVNYGFYATS